MRCSDAETSIMPCEVIYVHGSDNSGSIVVIVSWMRAIVAASENVPQESRICAEKI